MRPRSVELLLAAAGALALAAIIMATHWLAAWDLGWHRAKQHAEEAHGVQCEH